MAKGNQKRANGSALEFEAQLWAAADKTSRHMDADNFRSDLHLDLKADSILANPSLNMSDWGGEHLRQDVCYKFGMPQVNNANYAWIQHPIRELV